MADFVGDVLHGMMENAARLRIEEALRAQQQEAERRFQEALRAQERRAAAALGEAVSRLERQLQERDGVISALRHALDERLQRLEARVAALDGREGGEKAGGQGALERLEARLGQLEGAVQSALARVFPRVEALVTQLERRSSRGLRFTAVPAACAQDGERQRLEARIQEVRARMEAAQAAPCPLGEGLCKAASEGRVEDVRRLLDSGADVNHTNVHGRSPLLSAFISGLVFKSGDPAVVCLLLQRGAAVNAVDLDGCSALHLTASCDAAGLCVRVLLAAGADADARDVDGETPLHLAAWSGNEAAARALLAAGASKSLRCWSGPWWNKTPFEIAKTEIDRYLLHC